MKRHRQTVDENKKNQRDIFCLDNAYSTTRRITTLPPTIDNKPDDEFETVLFLPEGSERKGEGGLRTKGYFKKSQTGKPLVSIVTVVFNGDKYLEETIQSVIGQSYENVEYIVIDGGSTDETLDILKKYEGQIDYWVSEKDDGIYHAMNKGITLTTGKWVGFINSGDMYVQNTLSSIEKIEQIINSQIIFGSNTYIDEHKKVIHTHYPIKDKVSAISHPSTFTKKAIFLNHGLYRTDFRIFSDSYYYLITTKHCTSFYTNQIFSYMREGGVSSKFDFNIAKELYILYRDCNQNPITAFLKSYMKPIIKNLMMTILGKKITYMFRKKITKGYK
jgi:glycosyltransferase involved in cell wall biosynthesis